MWSSGSKSCLIFCTHLSFPVAKEKKDECAGRESNPGLVRGRDVYYHCTTGADTYVGPASFYSVWQLCDSTRQPMSKCNVGRSYGAMAARWIPDPKVCSQFWGNMRRLWKLKVFLGILESVKIYNLRSLRNNQHFFYPTVFAAKACAICVYFEAVRWPAWERYLSKTSRRGCTGDFYE